MHQCVENYLKFEQEMKQVKDRMPLNMPFYHRDAEGEDHLCKSVGEAITRASN